MWKQQKTKDLTPTTRNSKQQQQPTPLKNDHSTTTSTPFEDLKSLSNFFSELYDQPDYSDVILVVNGTRIPAHRIILSRSPVFKAMLSGKMKDSSPLEVVISDPKIHIDSFRDLLKFIYTGALDINRKYVLYLLYCSKLYSVSPLQRRCIELAEFTKEDVLEMFPSVLDLGEDDLLKKCKLIIDQYTNYILTSNGALDINKDILLEIISSSSLQITEVVLFEFVIRWIEYHKASPEMISEIISYIRFPLIQPRHLIEIVKPYPIVPLSIYVEALEYHYCPDKFDKKHDRFCPRGKVQDEIK